MSRKYPSLEEFIAQNGSNLYIRYKTIICYMRKGRVLVDGQICTALTIANITNTRRRNNGEFNPRHKRTGLFSEFEGVVRKLAAENGYDGVYVESVFNEFLHDVLIRYGYHAVNIHNPEELSGRCYWRKNEQ